jgi:2-keto-4-pentenoate hydratase/2-oxohepta-3-ene-1,7-dioic acid hydratase in catechol pathway
MNKYFARIFYKNKIFWTEIDFKDKSFKILSKSYFEKYTFTGQKIPFLKNKIKFLPPTIPTKIVCLGLNYIDHAKELNMSLPKEPIIFLKPPSAIIGDREKIFLPKNVKRLDYEGELALVIKKSCKNIQEKDCEKYILGYSCFNDVTARDLQKKDGQWTRAKSFDTFAPIGPYIVSGINVGSLIIQTLLNDKIVQNSNTRNMIFKVNHVVSFISKIMTLYAGDIISLGTPPGVGKMHRGDKVTIKIENIGELTNYVK